MVKTYEVWRIIPQKPGCVDFCGTVQESTLAAAEIVARLMYHCSGGEYLEVNEEPESER